MNKKLILVVVALFSITNLFAQTSSSSEPTTVAQEKTRVAKATKPVKKSAPKQEKAAVQKTAPVKPTPVKSIKAQSAAGTICSTCTYPNIKPAVSATLVETHVSGPVAEVSRWSMIRPVITISGGASFTNNQNYTINETRYFENIVVPMTFNWNGQNSPVQTIGGIFLGLEMPLIRNPELPVSWQFGLSYYVPSSPYTITGVNTKGAVGGNLDPDSYSYKVQSQQFLFDNKILLTFGEIYHPYISAGIGFANNKAYNYQSQKMDPASGWTPFIIADKSSNSLSYEVGGGLDVDLKRISHLENWRLGIAYRYVGLGNAALGKINSTSPPTVTPPEASLKPTINTQEVLVQLTYVF